MFFLQPRGRPGYRVALLFVLTVLPAVPQSEQLAEQSRHGKELMSQGHFDEAVVVYQQMVKALPDNPGLLLNLGMAEEMAGHPDRAIRHLEAVLKVQPRNIPALTSVAMSYLQLNQPTAAIAPLKKLLALDTLNLNARGMLASSELSLEHFQQAAVQYRELTALNPSDATAWYGLGKSYEGLATQDFEHLSRLDNQSGYVALLLADARVQQRQFKSAFFFYREAKKKMPDLAGLSEGLAQVYRNTGHPDWAATEGRREMERDARACQAPASPACLFSKGRFLQAVREHATEPSLFFWNTRAYNALAIQAFDQLERLPESVELHALKAQILHDHRQNLEASHEWRAALAIAPDKNDVRLRTELATSFFQARDYQAAIPTLEELLRDNPESPSVNFMLGECLWRIQQADQALPFLEIAIKRRPNMLSAHAALGLALASLGRNAEAIPHLEKAVTLDDDGSLHYSLARSFKAEGNASGAQANMEEYSRIQRKNAEVNSTVASESEITGPLDRK